MFWSSLTRGYKDIVVGMVRHWPWSLASGSGSVDCIHLLTLQISSLDPSNYLENMNPHDNILDACQGFFWSYSLSGDVLWTQNTEKHNQHSNDTPGILWA